jgi:flagellar hook-basal body complex protein FliE
MAQISQSTSRFGETLLSELRQQIDRNEALAQSKPDPEAKAPSFSDHLESGIDQVNEVQKHADKKATDLATGKDTNIHETMLAASNAELNFNLMVQIRNKALQAYQEIMRMPV